ncbi:primosomal protein N' [Bacteroidales bacterium OttesenSCG-928-B11]|nr:primosomal protein N' [Bacteroidales bacterium OttesenSCG-928-E04]MDL2312336.1 primosomal protein N' [Bacteroidales bacterium OttesenSCG-928-B11]MDL2326283.1 primosomal protein N' [Bacteroidales bacterium OttesenSCG-928-A14]
MERITYFVDVLLPLPLPGYFTYRIPHDFSSEVKFGTRVVVPFGKSKLYSALVVRVHTDAPKQVNTKYILALIDEQPVVSEKQFELWQWLSHYYMCEIGEVMAIALPSALKIASETKIMLSPEFDGDISTFMPREISVVEALSYRSAVTVDEMAKIAGVQKIIPVIKSLVEKGAVITDEEIRDPYKPKVENYLSLTNNFTNEQAFYKLLDDLGKSKRNAKQVDLLLSFFMQLQERKEEDKPINFALSLPKKEILTRANVSPSRVETLITKGFLKEEQVKVSRLSSYDSYDETANIALSEEQQVAMRQILSQFEDKQTVLLHGVTGSGKTEIYIKLIDKVLSEGKQVLYLLPEIALTSQIVNRLRRYFGDRVGVYHSRFNEFERVEIWNKVLNPDDFSQESSKYQLILGARSALLLPYQNLGLIIVDEEHDASYKQYDPAPRYHARDSAIVLANMHNAKTLLGTATPSLESYYNAKQGKYGLVELTKRYAESMLPEIWLVDLVKATRQKKIEGHFSQFLIEHIEQALANKEQVIIFQNRRGFALRLFCNTCQTMPMCIHCDVSLTYHKRSSLLKCHYCGYAIEVPSECPTCHSKDIEMKGFGTEKVEDFLQERFPEARIARMDLDTTRSKTGYQKIIADFENQQTDILVGTQMVTKGLDFDRVSVVGILNADNLLSYPDFRSFERAFQTLAQVSGRAGRKQIPGKVIIQSYNTAHPALEYVVGNDYQAMYNHQMAERQQFKYPPCNRLIKLTLKHHKEEYVTAAGNELALLLQQAFPGRILGPEFPLVSRIQNQYLKDFWIKLDKNQQLDIEKAKLKALIEHFRSHSQYKSVRVVVNVDA